MDAANVQRLELMLLPPSGVPSRCAKRVCDEWNEVDERSFASLNERTVIVKPSFVLFCVSIFSVWTGTQFLASRVFPTSFTRIHTEQ